MSPRSKKQYEAMREEKIALIMDAALEHFAREGYHNTTITHLAKHAGISKGLMYNYFESKEELLSAIINKSIAEISAYFDPDMDGILTEEEFELFVRKYFMIVKEKIAFWRLFSQLMLQKDVRDQFLKSDPDGRLDYLNGHTTFKTGMLQTINEYFMRKKAKKTEDFDHFLDMNMFLYTMEGFAMITIYSDRIDEVYFEKAVNRIIELYK